MKIKYSIIIPAFNAEKTIFECVNSLLAQKGINQTELIIVDDGSTDNTKTIIQEIIRINKLAGNKIKYIYQTNSGPAKARNVGANNAKGEILLFTDSDCIAEKNWLTEMIKPFTDKRIAAVQGAYKSRQIEFIARFIQIEIEHRYELMKKTSEIDWIGSYSAAYRQEIFSRMNGFDENFPIASGEDSELSYKIYEAGHKLGFNPNAIVYHTHPITISKYLKTKFFRAFFRPKMYSKHKTKMIKDSYTPQSLKLQILCFYALVIGIIFSAIIPLFFWIVIASIAAHILLGIDLFIMCLKKDKLIAIASPIILFLRSAVFGIGLIVGKLNG